MNLTIGLLADVILLAIIAWKLISGVRSGLVRMLGGLISLGGGIFAGSLLKSLLADGGIDKSVVASIAEGVLAAEPSGYEKLKAMTELKNQIANLSIEIAEKLIRAELEDKRKADALIQKELEMAKLN